jgi:hypothetical protein
VKLGAAARGSVRERQENEGDKRGKRRIVSMAAARMERLKVHFDPSTADPACRVDPH